MYKLPPLIFDDNISECKIIIDECYPQFVKALWA